MKKFKRKILCKILDELIGSLQHASFGIPGGSECFSPVQMAMKGTNPWIAVTLELTQCFNDWGAIVKHIKRIPTSVLQLVNDFPHYIRYSDSCILGTGGVVTPGLENVRPILWQVAWPTDIIHLFDKGQITINDLELAGIVIEWLVLESTPPTLQFKHVAIFCDNVSAVVWMQKLRCGCSKCSIETTAIPRNVHPCNTSIASHTPHQHCRR